MSVAPESIEVGKCYLTSDKRVVQALQVLSDGSVSYRHRQVYARPPFRWTGAAAPPQYLASLVKWEVPCDWTPERDE